MAESSKIEWTDATWNPITGCTLVSEGCRNCYAARLAATRLREHPSRAGLARLNAAGEAKFTGEVRLNEQWLDQPLSWRRPRMIFVCAHGDLFHEAVQDEWIDLVFAVMALAPQHTFQVLTKRPARMRDYLSNDWASRARIVVYNLTLPTIDHVAGRAQDMLRRYTAPGFPAPLPHVWLGVSVEDQARADERIPDLLATPAAVRFVSAEPLLGPVDLTWIAEPDDEKDGVIDALLGCNWIDGMGHGVAYRTSRPGYEGRVMTRHVCSSEDEILASRKLDWVIVGGESGPGARPMHPVWARSLRDQCKAAGVAFFFKQWGDWLPVATVGDRGPRIETDGHRYLDDGTMVRRVGKAAAGRLLDGVEHNCMPGGAHV